MVRMGMHAYLNYITQFLQPETGIEDQTQTGQLVQHQMKVTSSQETVPRTVSKEDVLVVLIQVTLLRSSRWNWKL